MRLLVVGHSYIHAFAQGKYVAMKKMDDTLRIRLVVPREMPYVFMRYRREVAPGMEQEEVVCPRGMYRSNMTWVLDPARLAMLLRTFKPDHIHIEEDPHSLIGIETVFLARIAWPSATISFFIWDNLARKPRFPLNVVKVAFTRYSLSRSAMVVCGNNEAHDLLRTSKRYRGATLVSPQLGLDPAEYSSDPPAELTRQLSKGCNEVLIGYLGRLVPEKGIRLLIEALSGLQQLAWKLVVVGSGPLKQELQTHWKNHLNGRLILLDAVPHDAVPNHLKCLDVFVLPSYSTPYWKEQFGFTLAQAMMAGVACIGSSSGAIPDVLGSGGIIFQEGDIDSLTNALKILIESKAERIRLAKKGQEIALQRYTNQAVASAFLAAFMKLKRNQPDAL